MNRLIAYTLGKVGDALRSVNLENERSQISRRESEEDMSINKKKDSPRDHAEWRKSVDNG